MENGNILVLSERQIMSVLDMPAALESVETSLREIAEGRCINPMKLHIPAERTASFLLRFSVTSPNTGWLLTF